MGPAAFVTAWAVGGLRAESYSPVEDAISRLAAVDASTHPLMTAGFVGFAVGVGAYAPMLGQRFDTRSGVAAGLAAVTTLGVALTPLDAGVDTLHGIFAGTGYVAMAALPALAAPCLATEGRPRAATVARGLALVAAGCLLATTVTAGTHGMFQRLGLGVVDGWIIWTAVQALRAER